MDKIKQIMEEHPLELIFSEDARYHWPARWAAAEEYVTQLEDEIKALRECLQSARSYLDPSPIIQGKIDALLTRG